MRKAAGSDEDARQVPKSWQMPIPGRHSADGDPWSASPPRSASRRVHCPRRWLPAGGPCRQDRWCPRRYFHEMWPAGCGCCKESAARRRARRQAPRSPPGEASQRRTICLGKTISRDTSNARYHPCCQCLIPHRETQQEASPGQPAVTALLVETRPGATCRRRSAGAATRPGPSRSRWSADKVNPLPAIRIQRRRRARPAILRRSR